MGRLHTHYENLKVAHNAPPEVVRAAYRVLAQRYHPDVNPSPDAARIMKILNESYAVLSDPRRRAEHDAWIEDQLIKESLDEAGAPAVPERSAARRAEGSSSKPPSSPLDKLNSRLARTSYATYFGFGCALVALLAWTLNSAPTLGRQPASSSPSSQPEQLYVGDPRLDASPPPAQRPTLAPPSLREFTGTLDAPGSAGSSVARWSPTGRPWPTRAAYLDGFQRRASSGLSTLTIDNTSGGADVYVKLCRASADRCDGLRHVFIPLGSTFTMSSITPGRYDIRYRSLDNGALAKSEPIQLVQVEEDRGTRYSNVRLTLYRVAGGNTTFENLPEDRF